MSVLNNIQKERIRHAKATANWTNAELARAFEVSESTIRNVLNPDEPTYSENPLFNDFVKAALTILEKEQSDPELKARASKLKADTAKVAKDNDAIEKAMKEFYSE